MFHRVEEKTIRRALKALTWQRGWLDQIALEHGATKDLTEKRIEVETAIADLREALGE